MSERAHSVRDADATLVLPTPGRRRFGFAPALERQASAADLSALGGLNLLIEAANPILAAVPQLRHALRHPDPAGLQLRLREQMAAFERIARAADVPDDRLQVARYALCALLDDSAAATPWGRDWIAAGLLAEGPAEESGHEFFVVLEKLLAAPAEQRDLLEFFYVCLALGYEGRYRSGEGGRQALAQFRSRLHEVLAQQQPGGAPELSERWQGAQLPAARVPRAIVLWSVASACALMLAALYFGYTVSLGALSDPVARDLARLPRLPIFLDDLRTASAAGTKRSRELARAIGLTQVEVSEAAGAVLIVLKADELFASGSARLHSGLEPVILKVAEALDRVPGAVIVTGHTDDVPIRTARFPSNWELSAERARSVAGLMRLRIRDGGRLRTEGLADSDPVVANDSPANRTRNRRVTIILKVIS